MNILISTDIEGVAGVVDPQQVRAGNPEYERARLWMTQEANAAIQGAFQGGAREVWVNDSHGAFRNIIASELDSRATLITGKPRVYGMMSGLEFNVDAVALVGHHSAAQGKGVLAHTINSFAFSNVNINGINLGEPGLYGLLAGEKGVPVIFGSGDQYLEIENAAFFPDAIWVQTKFAMGNTTAASKTIESSCAFIREGMYRAVTQVTSAAPFQLDPPYLCTLQTNTPALADLFCLVPYTKRINGIALSFEQESIEHIIRTLNVFSMMSAALR